MTVIFFVSGINDQTLMMWLFRSGLSILSKLKSKFKWVTYLERRILETQIFRRYRKYEAEINMHDVALAVQEYVAVMTANRETLPYYTSLKPTWSLKLSSSAFTRFGAYSGQSLELIDDDLYLISCKYNFPLGFYILHTFFAAFIPWGTVIYVYSLPMTFI